MAMDSGKIPGMLSGRSGGQGATQPCLRGQGATEYLIILGVVLFIALLAVFILGFFPETAQDVTLTESQLYWQGQAKPIRINGAVAGNGTLCGRPEAGGYGISIENTGPGPLNVTGVLINGVPKLFCLPDGSSQNLIRLSGLEKKAIVVYSSDSAICTANQLVSAELSFVYASDYLSGQMQ